MTKQRLHEWQELDARALGYHEAQWSAPKESTKAFASFIAPRCEPGGVVLDLACGAGAVTAFLALQHPRCSFLGLDVSPELVGTASELGAKRGLTNLAFRTADWFDLPGDLPQGRGVISTQTLSWLPEMRRPLEMIFDRLRPEWLAISSLFYEGDITCTVEAMEHKRSRASFYNCYSIPDVARVVQSNGYSLTCAEPFEIPVDLPKPRDVDFMGTRTITVLEDDGRRRRMQISGPLLMNWYHLLIQRDE